MSDVAVASERVVVVYADPRTIVVRGAGLQGPPGPAGGGGGPGSYLVYTQSTPAATWVITHGIGHPVHVTFLDASGIEFLTYFEQHPPYTTVSAIFPMPTTGTAVLS